MKILHIEDDLGIQTTVELFFKVVIPEAGFISASTGTKGLELARQSEPDVILLDLGLPDINGYEVITRLREFCHAPIVVITARREEGVEETCYSLGADEFVRKPFRHKEMVECINRVVKERVAWASFVAG